MKRLFVCLALLTLCLMAWAGDQAVLTPEWTAKEYPGLEAIEQAVITLTNAERDKVGLKPLSRVTTLAVGARQHSTEMGEQDYFAHESPVEGWRSPWQRAYRAGYWGQQVGENIIAVKNHTLTTPEAIAAHMVTQWMNSPGHRANILNTKWSLLGVGVTKTGDTYYGTQLFAVPLVILEKATLTALNGELAELTLAGAARGGMPTLWVNGTLLQTLPLTGGKFSATVGYPRDSGMYTITIGVGKQAAWTATLDTTATPRAMLKDERPARPGVVTRATVAVRPFTGMRLTGTAIVPAERAIGLLQDGEIIKTLTADAQQRVTFEAILPQRPALYLLGLTVDDWAEELLFIDTTQPIDTAFRCRPK